MGFASKENALPLAQGMLDPACGCLIDLVSLGTDGERVAVLAVFVLFALLDSFAAVILP